MTTVESTLLAARGKVLVVDDSESTRYVVSTWLRRDGYEVIEATTGGEALNVVQSQSIDMVVLDVNLPDMTGFEVCEFIKESDNSVPVLHVSATAVGSANRTEGLRRGADGYLTEPVEREELLANVGALLRGAAAERTARRLVRNLRRLNEATLALNEARNLQQLMAAIVSGASALLDVPASAALAIEGAELRAACMPGQSARIGTSVAAADEDEFPSLGALTTRARLEEHIGISLGESRDERGMLVLHIGKAPEDEAIAEEHALMLEQFGRAARAAVRNMRGYDIERHTAAMLQQSLLPDVIPEITDLDIAVRYRANAAHVDVGGDFYDIFVLDDEHVAFALGDVVGHSLEAAAIMAQLRTAIRAYMLEGHGPAATLHRLNGMLQRFHPGVSATACCAVYNWRTGECQLSNAGHLPPLIVSSGVAKFQPYGGTLLGVEHLPAPVTRFTLRDGDVLMFYTDGLIERRGESLDVSMARLAQAAALPLGNIDEYCDRILRDVGPETPMDDIAVVIVTRILR